jgi:hypothetical protein
MPLPSRLERPEMRRMTEGLPSLASNAPVFLLRNTRLRDSNTGGWEIRRQQCPRAHCQSAYLPQQRAGRRSRHDRCRIPPANEKRDLRFFGQQVTASVSN